jgi:hypothetical protein
MSQFYEYYSFNKKAFANSGYDQQQGLWFIDLIASFEEDFHAKFPHCFANHLFANTNTMNLIGIALQLEDNEMPGMDLIDGQIDMEANMKLEEYSDSTVIYALGSRITENEDEPILLVTIDTIPDGQIILKYLDEDEPSEDDHPLPIRVDQEGF